MYQLQLCPFCGGEACETVSSDSSEKLYFVKIECKDCGATQSASESFNPPSAELEASERWNNRSSVVKVFLDPDPYTVMLWYDCLHREVSYRDYLKEWKIPEENWHFYGYTPKTRKPKVTK